MRAACKQFGIRAAHRPPVRTAATIVAICLTTVKFIMSACSRPPGVLTAAVPLRTQLMAPAQAGLISSDPVKNARALLRNALPVNNKYIREIQRQLEGISESLRIPGSKSLGPIQSVRNWLLSELVLPSCLPLHDKEHLLVGPVDCEFQRYAEQTVISSPCLLT